MNTATNSLTYDSLPGERRIHPEDVAHSRAAHGPRLRLLTSTPPGSAIRSTASS